MDFFVKAAQSGATRCCDGSKAADDMSECRCPKKDAPPFKKKIGEWCAGVATCPKMLTDEEEAEDLKMDYGFVAELYQ